ncbi:MAG: hypothetical protein ACRDQU_21780 [Pseudonocardiaceae bacterium]
MTDAAVLDGHLQLAIGEHDMGGVGRSAGREHREKIILPRLGGQDGEAGEVAVEGEPAAQRVTQLQAVPP